MMERVIHRKIETSLYEVAVRFLGTKEIRGPENNAYIEWCFSLTKFPKPYSDEISWCSAILNGWCYHLPLPRSGSAAARSWLEIGTPITIEDARIGNDIVILRRGPDPQPGPEIINAPGHVTVFGGMLSNDHFKGIGGNQRDMVCEEIFPVRDILGIRRLA